MSIEERLKELENRLYEQMIEEVKRRNEERGSVYDVESDTKALILELISKELIEREEADDFEGTVCAQILLNRFYETNGKVEA